MRKDVKIIFCLFFVGVVLLSAFASAGWLSDLWGKITGHSTDGNVTCTDSDGGTDYYVRGTVRYDGGSVSDVCEDGPSLREYYCDENPNVQYSGLRYNCPYGCSSGACLEQGSTPAPEEPVNNTTPTPTNKTNTTTTPPSGGGSSGGGGGGGGSTTPTTNTTSTCTDSDGGLNYYVKGFTKYGTNNMTDICEDGPNLREYYCAYTSSSSSLIPITGVRIYCSGGCSNGACISSSGNGTTTTPSNGSGSSSGGGGGSTTPTNTTQGTGNMTALSSGTTTTSESGSSGTSGTFEATISAASTTSNETAATATESSSKPQNTVLRVFGWIKRLFRK